MASAQSNQPRHFNPPNYLPNGAPAAGNNSMPSGATPTAANQARVFQTGPVRVLCIADVRGNLRSLNDLARDARANYIIHTGDFGFYDDKSLDRIAEKTLRHVAQYSPLLTEPVKRTIATSPAQPSIKERIPREQLPLSELPKFLDGTHTLDVPVYTVWGACEDVQVLEKLRSGEYKVNNLHIIDEAHSRLLEVGGVKLRLLGLGGAVVMHKLFDNGEGRTTIAGGQGTMWTTLLQMGELVDTANRVYDPTETRVFRLLNYALELVSKMPSVANGGNPFGGQSAPGSGQIDESAFKNMWNFNLADAAYGWLLLDVEAGRIATEMRAQGFNFAHRSGKSNTQQQAQSVTPAAGSPAPPAGISPVVNQAPQQRQPPPSAAPTQQPRPAPTPPVAQQQAPRGGAQPPRTGPSPAPVTPKEPVKPATPQPVPTASSAPATENKPTAPEGKPNGTPSTDKPQDAKPEPQQQHRKPSHALFIRNIRDEEEARSLIPEEDRVKVERFERSGNFYIVHFKTAEDMTSTFDHVPRELKNSGAGGERNKPNVAIYKEFMPRGAGTWQGSNRGPNTPGGYRSGGASDSEGGRGGYRGGRGRGPRGGGNERGGGRGRGGRGAYNSKPNDAPAGTPSSSGPTPVNAEH
ncbi:hypothetical protein EJ06DRAFT_181146 [Trichodelitschia bisporula]|uniref:Uncharacterized protein n=1 Tax=Trichodelitschia bisporula TaxID=703511 RepID=A0A6G1HM30_9PEZI|nr:hypothetical protein EJ06DRAFT_181146 [Trichodelitschia bisporula]